MTDQVITAHAITVQIPKALYERVKKAADASDRSIEDTVVEFLNVYFDADFTLSVDDLDEATDDQLKKVVERRLAASVDERLSELAELGNRGKLTPTDTAEQENLLDQYDEFVLLRSTALALLKERGHDIQPYLQVNLEDI